MPWRPHKFSSPVTALGSVVILVLISVDAPGDELPSKDEYLQPAGESPGEPALDPAAIEAEGAVIGNIVLNNRNIFDLSNPLENKLLYRWANRLHIVTKPHVIESQLLFEEGDTYSVRLADETERHLRSTSYISEADVTPVKHADGVVDLEVTTIDVWTLTPEVSLGRSGGENRIGIGILEQNLLGRGIQIGAKYRSNVDRDSLSFKYIDDNMFSERYRLAANYSNNSDGFSHGLSFGKPFYALDRRRAGNLTYSKGEQIDQLYDLGEPVAEYNNQFEFHQAMLGWSGGLKNDWVRRYSAGVAYSRNQFDPVPGSTLPVMLIPDDREYLYPFLGFELLEDHYETTVNFDQIHRTEDRFLGTWLNFRLGYASQSNGSSNDAWLYQAGFSKALVTTKKTSLTLGAGLNGRWEDGDAQNALLSGIARFHRRLTENQLFFARLSGVAGKNLDIDNPVYLGGDTGLRGYPLRYQNGDSKALLTLEHRIYTNWYPFRLVHVGAAIFFDAGRTWGGSPVGAPNLGVLKDVGFGVRLGNTRSGHGKVLHLDIAFPLDGGDDIDGVQILLDAKSSF